MGFGKLAVQRRGIYWLTKCNVSVQEWRHCLQKQITTITDADLDKLLAEKLFAQVRKSLQNDFDLLMSRNFLQRLTTGV